MTRKEKTQQNRYDKQIAPLLDQIATLCEKYKMPFLTAVQLYVSDESGARISANASGQEDMAFPLLLGSGLATDKLIPIMKDSTTVQLKTKAEMVEEDIEPLSEHALHCEDCKELMEDLVMQGEDVTNIYVPSHTEELDNLINDMKTNKLPFIIPRKPLIIH